MHDDIPVLTSDASLKESLEVFARHDGERLLAGEFPHHSAARVSSFQPHAASASRICAGAGAVTRIGGRFL